MLSIQMLNDMPVGTIFATGVAMDEPGGLFMARTGKELRWIAVRGHGPLDWAVYCHLSENNTEWIRRHGDKVHTEVHIKKLVPCDQEAFEYYRP